MKRGFLPVWVSKSGCVWPDLLVAVPSLEGLCLPEPSGFVGCEILRRGGRG